MNLKFQVAAFWLAGISSMTIFSSNGHAENNVFTGQNDEVFMEETVTTPAVEEAGKDALYGAYSSVYHHLFPLADRWIIYGRQKAPGEVLIARDDASFLLNALNTVAAKRKHAPVSASSCEFMVLRALLKYRFGSRDEALEMLKRVALNYPTDPSIQFVKTKIKTTEIEASDSPLTVPPDVMQSGGQRNGFAKWKLDKFPLKVFIPTDMEAAKVPGYTAGDGLLIRRAFETWQKQTGGKIQFVFQTIQSGADISCAWVSEPKQLEIIDAVGVCSRSASRNGFMISAGIKILTFTGWKYLPSSFENQFRKNCLESTCLHEVGHSLGLNHSSSGGDLMYPVFHWKPMLVPSTHDTAALNSLYLSNVYELLTSAFDGSQSGDYKSAMVSLNKAVSLNVKDTQTRDTICFCLADTARVAMKKADYPAAIELLTKARQLLSQSESEKTKILVLKTLQYAYLKSGKLKEAEDLEKQNVALQNADTDSGPSFLDQYGLKTESIPHYEKALLDAPNDVAIREKFCLLLVTLAKDEMDFDRAEQAIPLLTRAKNLLTKDVSHPVMSKVFTALCRAYQNLELYNEVDETSRERTKLMFNLK